MIILIWPLVILFTLVLYFLILVTLPFSQTVASVFLFTLIAFWSRLPGVGIPTPFWILYVADVIDILAMIVAINVGGIYGAILSLFANLGGRACGAFTSWGGNAKDAGSMFLTCLMIPYVHVMTGDLFVTMIMFQIIRILLIFIYNIISGSNLPRFFTNLATGGTALFFINILYVKLFGDFFDNLMKAGVAFSWPLFTFASVVIFGSYGVMYFFSDKDSSYNLKAIKKRVKDLAKQSADKKKVEKQHKKYGTKQNSTNLREKKESKVAHAETIEKGCPACKEDVKGNNKAGFYCTKCNTTYRRRDLLLKRF